MGKIDKKKWMAFIDDEDQYSVGAGCATCPICHRIYDNTMDEHHLIPKSKKGTETVTLHKVCHMKIHSIFTEKELANEYSTIELLQAHPDVQKFAKWVAKKPANYVDSSKMSNSKRRNR